MATNGVGVPITVVAASFGPVFDCGLAVVLGTETDLFVVADQLDLGELERVIARHAPLVALLAEKNTTGPLVFNRLRGMRPGLGLVVLVHDLSERRARQLVAFGANACLSLEASAGELVAAIRLAAQGMGMWMPAARRDVAARADAATLTPRECEVLGLLQAGASNGEIARTLQIGTETVKTHAKRIFVKLGVKRRRELIAVEFLNRGP